MTPEEIKKSDRRFSKLLAQIPGPPKSLFVCGDISLLNDRICVAMVGSRKVSDYGHSATSKIAGDLARQGIVIVSGLALGVDAIAHLGALEAGGQTIAVLPSSLQNIYPSTNRLLAKRILEQGGALVTEYLEPIELLPYCFLARNRIISGLCRGTIICEAAVKSGSLHTANFALEQGREVMAIPGSIFSPTSVGTNNLIKTGATPITSAQEVLEALGLEQHTGPALSLKGATDQESTILKLLSSGILSSDILLAKSQLDPRRFAQTITSLEICGRIKSLGHGGWTLA